MSKALIVSTVSRQFTLFDKDNIKILKSLGYKVHCAANYEDATLALNALDIVRHQIDIQRSPFSFKNIKAFRQLLKLMKTEQFDLVHCHAPMGALLGRLCARLSGRKNVLYTAHGFHFYQGASLVNNLIYKTIERIAAYWTDGLITMNLEDYSAAKKFKLNSGGKVYFIPGVGVDTRSINMSNIKNIGKRHELDIPEDVFLILSIGELIPRKNHVQAIMAVANLLAENENIKAYYAICGRGMLLDELKHLCRSLNIESRVKFLGYRNDIAEILSISDLFLFTSFQEGLPKSVIEAMAAGLPIVATKIRGNIDLIEDGINGFLVECKDVAATTQAIKTLLDNKTLRKAMSLENLKRGRNYDISVVNEIMKEIYTEFIKE